MGKDLKDSVESVPAHFSGKDAVGHVVEAQAKGIIARAESHAHEVPGSLSAAVDAARDTALLFALVWLLLEHLGITKSEAWWGGFLIGGSWLVWRAGRSAWLGWSRLERLHRVLQEEKWEIEHHRKQERDELRELYRAKGFEGKLLEDVLDVLMADGDRLLRVMVEEELGLSLEYEEHPLQQALGAICGSAVAMALALMAAWLSPVWGPPCVAIFGSAIVGTLAAWYEHNRLVPAIVWNVGIVVLPLACIFFLVKYL